MKRKINIKKNLPFLLIFLVGFLIFSYPFISQKFYEIKANDEIVIFNKEKERKITHSFLVNNFLYDLSIIKAPKGAVIKIAKTATVKTI